MLKLFFKFFKNQNSSLIHYYILFISDAALIYDAVHLLGAALGQLGHVQHIQVYATV